MPRGLVKHYSWVCLWGGFWKRSAFKSVGWVKITLTRVSGHHPTHLGPSWDKKAKEGQILYFSSWVGTSIFSCPWKSELLVYSGLRMTGLTPCPPHLQFPGVWLQTGSDATSFPGSHALGQRLNYTISFLGSPACECQILHPRSLRNCEPNPLPHLFCLSLCAGMYKHPVSSVSSGELWQIHTLDTITSKSSPLASQRIASFSFLSLGSLTFHSLGIRYGMFQTKSFIPKRFWCQLLINDIYFPYFTKIWIILSKLEKGCSPNPIHLISDRPKALTDLVWGEFQAKVGELWMR